MGNELDRAIEYRQNAEACLELAERMEARSLGPERIRLIEMAQHWLDLAIKVENSALSEMSD
jgi:hypothetical protein